MTRSESDPPNAGPAKRQRIAKLMARAGLCSRRDAEAWIVEGRVSLNGSTLTSPAVDVSPEDIVLVDGAPLPPAEKTRLFLFHKPRGLVTTDHDPEGRSTVANYLRENWPDGPRVVTIGRLDINTEGLLLLTNDGGLARLLELPQTGWVRRYRVRAKGTADPSALEALADGITIDGVDYAGIEAKLDRAQGANTWLTMGLREGKNREIKRVLEHLGLEVNRLIRLSFGPFQLLDLLEGAVEEVRTRVLRDQLGASLAEKAGVDFGDVEAPKAPRAETQRKSGLEARRRDAPKVVRIDGGRERGSAKPRSDDRRPAPERGRRDPPPDASPPKRERPTSGPRKHVSTIRAERAGSPDTKSRTRIERSDTRDRRDRTVKVERLVPLGARSPDPAEARRRPDKDARPPRPDRERRFDATRFGPEREPGGRRERGERPDHRDGAPHGRASPSAAGKRERIARRGVRPQRDDRPDRRDSAPRGRAAPSAAGKPERVTRTDARPQRGERPDHRDDARRGHAAPSPAGKSKRVTRTGARPQRGDRPEHRDGAPRERTGSSTASMRERVARSSDRLQRGEKPDHRERAPRERIARGGARSSGDRPDDRPSGRSPHAKPARSRPSGPREPARGATKRPRTERPAGVKPASRPGHPPDRGGRKPPRGPAKPGR